MCRIRLRNAVLLDRVHGHMNLPPVVVQAIDTAPVQRLRGLKQLGASSFLYPGAVHTRFEHSIGVAHLCREFLHIFQEKQPELLCQMTAEDVENCMLAGLCHDLGHGPFSHLFEDAIMARDETEHQGEKMATPGEASSSSDGNRKRAKTSTSLATSSSSSSSPPFDHEDMSLKLAQKLLRQVFALREPPSSSSSSLSQMETNQTDGSDAAAKSIKKHKTNKQPTKHTTEDETTTTAKDATPLLRSVDEERVQHVLQLMQGITSDRLPYGQLVTNKQSGLDVDKLDYFARDSLSCFGKPSADIRLHRLFYAAKLIRTAAPSGPLSSLSSSQPMSSSLQPSASLSWTIAYEEKMAPTVRELFSLRAKLHKFVYQHLVTKAVGHMIADAFRAAMPFVRVAGKTIGECVTDPELFLALGDWLLESIEWDPNPQLAPAQRLLRRLRCRDLYRPVCAWPLRLPSTVRAKEVTEELLSLSRGGVGGVGRGPLALSREQFVVEVVTINTGKGAQDPLSYVTFFNPKQQQPKGNPQLEDECGFSRGGGGGGGSALFTPQSFEERTLVVLHRCGDRAVLERAVEEWRRVHRAELI